MKMMPFAQSMNMKDQRSIEQLPCRSSATFQLGKEDVHVWCVASSLSERCDFQRLAGLLSEKENIRATQYRFVVDRQHFIFRNGLVRSFLARYLGIDPTDIYIKRTSFGKPLLESPSGGKALFFNLSHSNGMLLCAFSWQRRIGSDIEWIHPLPGMDEMVDAFLSSAEQIAYGALPDSLKIEAFYNCWTRKEAFLKAVGDGLSRGLDTFDVSLAPGEPAVLKRVGWAPEEVGRWTLQSITSIPGYAAAIAVEGNDWTLKCRQLTSDHLINLYYEES